MKDYREHPDQMGFIADYEAFLAELDRVWKVCFDALVPGGRLVCVVGDSSCGMMAERDRRFALRRAAPNQPAARTRFATSERIRSERLRIGIVMGQ